MGKYSKFELQLYLLASELPSASLNRTLRLMLELSIMEVKRLQGIGQAMREYGFDYDEQGHPFVRK